MKNRRGIHKGSIVWYYHRKLKSWKKGKVVSINMNRGPWWALKAMGLYVMERSTKQQYFVPFRDTAISAAFPKPTEPPKPREYRIEC